MRKKLLRRAPKPSFAIGAILALIVAAVGIHFVFFSHASNNVMPLRLAGQPASFWHNSTPTNFDDATLQTEGSRRSFVVIESWETDKLHKLKAANPNIAVFAYKDMSSIRVGECGGGNMAGGVDYCDANSNHPDWFLTYPNGQRMPMGGYGSQYQADIGNTAYQQAWAANVSSKVKSDGFDGVFIDNVLVDCDIYYYTSCSAKYNNDASFQNAYMSFLTNVRPSLQSAGLLTYGNLNGARNHSGIWDRFMTQMDGGYDEYWLEFSGGGSLSGGDWKTVVDEIAHNEANGKFTGVQPLDDGDTTRFRYAFASYMMGNGGRASITECTRSGGDDCYNTDIQPFRTEYTWNLGAASNSYYASGNGYRRDFVCGVSVVNPNGGTVHFDFGKTLVDEDGTSRSSIDLNGQQGMVLRQSGCNPGTATPTPTPTATAAPTATPIAGTVKVMPLGDSITNGWQVANGGICDSGDLTGPYQGSYRIALGQKYAAGRIQFVGSLSNGPAGMAGGNSHEGHCGWWIKDNNRSDGAGHNLIDQIDGWLAASKPDVILLQIGTNDIGYGKAPQTAANDEGLLLDKIKADLPNAKVLVATIPPAPFDVTAFNADLKMVVANKIAAGQHLYLVDNYNSGIIYPDDYVPENAVHPNGNGNTKLANSWASVLTPILNSTAATPTPTPTATPAPTSVTVPFRLNTGGAAFTDPQGNAWQADNHYTAGTGSTYSVTNAISGTTNQTMFQSERWGMTNYDIPVANGTYTVKLDFAEINPGVSSRVFNVSAEGTPWLTNFDIRTKTGGDFIADTETKNITVTGGALNLVFNAVVENPKISGIEILPVAATPTPTVTPTPAPAGVTGDMDGNSKVNVNDLSYLLNKWGGTDTKADINHSGKVDVQDLSALLAHWTG